VYRCPSLPEKGALFLGCSPARPGPAAPPASNLANELPFSLLCVDRGPAQAGTGPTLIFVPEIPEVEITARRLGRALSGVEVDSALAPGMVALKTVDPPLDALSGRRIEGVRRVGKMPVVELGDRDGDDAGALSLLVHLMSAGRLQVFERRASLRDRRSRLLVRLADGRELRLREFGTRQRAWAKLLRAGEVEEDEMVATLGPEAWPAPPLEELAVLVDQPRHLHPMLRDQRLIAGIGRSWVDEILWEARLSPFKQGAELEPDEVERLHAALDVLPRAIDHYEEVIGDVVPDKMPMPLRVHKRQGEPCPRCGTTLEAVHFAEHVTTYCPEEQTGGRVLKDRRLSRLLK
jgi:formamidopyrimidine-DNA glycosylase